MSAIERAQERWGHVAVAQGLRDPTWLRANRAAIVGGLMARGIARPDAQAFMSRKIAAAEGALRTVATGGDHHAS